MNWGALGVGLKPSASAANRQNGNRSNESKSSSRASSRSKSGSRRSEQKVLDEIPDDIYENFSESEGETDVQKNKKNQQQRNNNDYDEDDDGIGILRSRVRNDQRGNVPLPPQPPRGVPLPPGQQYHRREARRGNPFYQAMEGDYSSGEDILDDDDGEVEDQPGGVEIDFTYRRIPVNIHGGQLPNYPMRQNIGGGGGDDPGSGDDDDEDEDGQGGPPNNFNPAAGGPLHPPAQPPPAGAGALYNGYDACLEQLYAKSPFYRDRRMDQLFSSQMYASVHNESIQMDVLGGARVEGNLPRCDKGIVKMLTLSNRAFWAKILNSLGNLADLESLPELDIRAELDYFSDVSLISEYCNHYHKPPEDPVQYDNLRKSLGVVGDIIWAYYVKHRQRFVEGSHCWWKSILSLHSAAIRNLPTSHNFLTKVYKYMTFGKFIKLASSADSPTNHTKEYSKSACWSYLIQACQNGFVGLYTGDFAKIELEKCTVQNSQPDKGIIKDEASISERSFSHIMNLKDLFANKKGLLKKKFKDLTLSALMVILTTMHVNIANVKWDVYADFLILVLWYHNCQLVAHGYKKRRLLDTQMGLKKKPVAIPSNSKVSIKAGVPIIEPSEEKGNSQFVYHPVSGKRIMDFETIFIHHLEHMSTHYMLVKRTLDKMHGNATNGQSKASPSFMSGNLINYELCPSIKMEDRIGVDPTTTTTTTTTTFFTSNPEGYFDTVLFPNCQQFLPSYQIIGNLDGLLIEVMTKKGDVIDGVEVESAHEYYYSNFKSANLPPGTFESVMKRMPYIQPMASFVLDNLDHSRIQPVAELSFSHLAVMHVLSIVRGINYHKNIRPEPIYIPFASLAYSSMIFSILITNRFTIERNHSAMTILNISEQVKKEGLVDILMGDISGSVRVGASGGIGNSKGSSGGSSQMNSKDKEEQKRGLEKIAEILLQKHPHLSSVGDEGMLQIMSKYISDNMNNKYNQPATNNQRQQQPIPKIKELPLEILNMNTRLFMTWDDLPGKITTKNLSTLGWNPSYDCFPRIIRTCRKDIIVVTQDADFFLKTSCITEAINAFYTYTIKKFGHRMKLTGPYFKKFEELVGKTYREVLSVK